MGITDRSLLDLLHEFGSWISGALSMESWASGTCCECRGSVLGAGQGHRCRSCGRVFCRKCMQSTGGPGLDGGAQPRFCRFCYRAIARHVEAAAAKGCSEKLDPLAPAESSQSRLGNSRLAHLAESQQGSSPPALRCSTCRNYEDEDAEDSGRHFFSPMSEASQDNSDIDTTSVSTWNDFYSLKSSPLDSPSRAGDQGDNSPLSAKIDSPDQETPRYLRKSGAESENLSENSNDCAYENLAVYRSHESEKAQPPLDFENNSRIWYPPPPEDEDDDVEAGFFGYDDEEDDVGDSSMAFSSTSFNGDAFPSKEKPVDANKEHLRSAIRQHFRALVSQLLEGEGIPVGSENGGEGWLEIVSSLAWQAATFVKPDTNRGGSMDPTNYVKVKCISCGSPSDSTLIKGVVCTKNVKHKRMVSQHRNPKILLLGGSLEYQKVPNRLASINTILKQETDHIKMAVSKIETRRPNVLLVEKSVSSYAQEYLLAKEISLVLNVKRTLLERISRCTGAQIAPSIENLASTRLGQCEMFRIKKVSEECSSGSYPSKKSIKTLMFFEGCPRRLGCTVLLNGTCRAELKKVKHVVQYASFAAYHLSLETSFLSDEGASLPNIPLKPPVTNLENLMSSNTHIPTSSTSTISSTHQAIADKHQKVGSCSMLGIKCSDVSFLNEDTLEITSEPINSVFSPVDSQVNGDCTVQSISDVSLCGPESSNSGFQCKEPGDPSKLQTDASHEGKVLESSFKEDDDIANNRHLRAAHEQKVMDVDDGNGTPSEYFSTSDNHQSILVSLSSSCAVKGTVCERSQLFRIKFYGSFDKPLGRYLRDDLFDQTSCCRFCKEPAEAHIRCYTHQQGSLTISVKRLPSMKLPGESDGRIWMWHRCLKCEHKDGVPPAVRRVVMSDAAWGLSFGKFLELSFSNHTTANRIASCGHSLQKDCLRFYGFGSMVAFFRYSPVYILSICLPPLLLDFTCDVQQEWVRREASAISTKVEFLYEEISSALLDIEQRITTSKYEPLKTSIHKHILDLRDMSRRERYEYDVLFKPASAEHSQPSQIVDILELNRLRHCLLIDSYAWDRRLYLLDSVSKAKSFASKVDPQFSEILTRPKLKEWRDESFSKVGSLGNSSKETMIYGTSKKQNVTNLHVLECNSNNLVEMDLSIESIEGYVGPAGLNLVSGQCCSGDENQIGADDCSDTSFLECIPSPETNLSDKIDLAWTGSSQVLPSPSTSNAETDSVGLSSLMDNPSYRKVISPHRVYSFDSTLRFQNRKREGTSPSVHLSSVKSFDASRDFVKDPIQNMRQAYTQRPLRAMRSLSFLPSQTPVFITSTSHMVNEGARLLLPQPGFDNIVIAVYENDPTSIISYAISSQEHGNFVAYKLNQHEGLSENEKISIVGNQMGYCTGMTTLAARDSISYLRSDDLQSQCYGSDEPQQLQADLFLDPKEPHFRISFDDESSFPTDKVKFSVTCYFAKQFDVLRKKICPSDMDFIRSLSRCKRWKAQGGKSNVYFAKSLDERFIIKQVTKTELDSFEEFAPEYFKYLIKSINSGSPTCLAKVLGIYQVTIKHLNGGREVKTDLMVMENLLYRRNISRVYDLKGSSRARYNPDTSGNKVMLDLNLVETLRTKPIFLGSKAKRSLERAVWNDTSFLASIDIMDYSLLVGVDEERKELVIGIIDFMRQYTWDKHLETWVKASGILGGPKNASPTVVSPKQYKKRFRKAMSSYFLTVPDHWPS